MKQGAARHRLADRGDDLYETPDCATLALIRHVFLPARVWEPAAGRGAIARLLKTIPIEVTATDLVCYEGADEDVESGIDFLMERSALAPCIVTNPPYKLSDEFIRHGLSLGCRVVVLLRLMAIEGKRRSDIMAHCTDIYAGVERLPFMHREGWEGPKNSSSGAPFGWFDFRPTPRFGADPIRLHRISWRSQP